MRRVTHSLRIYYGADPLYRSANSDRIKTFNKITNLSSLQSAGLTISTGLFYVLLARYVINKRSLLEK